jgi:FkbM family methyltransferase
VTRTADEIRAMLDAAVALHNRGELVNAAEKYRSILECEPKHFDALHFLGVACVQQGMLAPGADLIAQAIEVEPRHPQPYVHLGNALLKLNRPAQALDNFDRALSINPDSALAHNNRGNALKDLGRFEEALGCYERALALAPDYADAYYNRANVLTAMHRDVEALDSFDKALAANPRLAYAHYNRGIVLGKLKREEEALESYRAALGLDPDTEYVLGTYIQSKTKLCDWAELPFLIAQLEKAIIDGKKAIVPFAVLSLIEDQRLHLKVARTYAEALYPRRDVLGPFQKSANHDRLRIAYYSADFHNHATAYLIAELLEEHDREKFEVYGISFGPAVNDEMSKRTSAAFHRFIDASELNDIDIARLSRELGIDIAVDLKGHTLDARLGAFAAGCAPIQVSYLGYPGTSGADYIDYIIADRTVIPDADRAWFSEKVVLLPFSYQVNDSRRAIAGTQGSRADFGLPDNGFVFCCFNNCHKILPHTFDSWMRILHAVEGSVLWLFESNPAASRNLRREAEARGIAGERLVFARFLEQDRHLARLKLADLFVDTLPYNAHTTASDALWAGLPVLTLTGSSFAGRVTTSLLNAVGLPELVTSSPEEYEALAMELARNPAALSAIRSRLESSVASSPLFNGKLFARHIEAAYVAMFARHQAGAAPEHLGIHAEPGAHAGGQTQNSNNEGGGNIMKTKATVSGLLQLKEPIQVLDIGAALINESPVYHSLLEAGLGYLHACEGDERHIANLQSKYGSSVSIYSTFLFDGTEQTLYIANPQSGMTSLLMPDPTALKFFNGFTNFGQVERTIRVKTQRLDDLAGLPSIDFLKMDIQGAELTVMKHGLEKLKQCLAIQLEVSYISLYVNQPTFGEIDTWLRSQGFQPHRFIDVKRWSIAPTVFNGDFRRPGNQLLESDIIYIRNPFKLERLADLQVAKLAALAHYCFNSVDLCVYMMLELERRRSIEPNAHRHYLELLSAK